MGHNVTDESGFSLLESLISVAILAVISGFILQMFISSSMVNQKAQNLDVGSAEAISAIEVVKQSSNQDDIRSNSFFEGCVFEETEGLKITKYYDSKWKQVFDANKTNAAKFILNVKVTQAEGFEREKYSDIALQGDYVVSRELAGLNDIFATIVEITPENKQIELISLNTSKYINT
jgi:prepilin-type N-terminal cleavage/methylation domain-containing protein